jgi:putative DNA primase/helicase
MNATLQSWARALGGEASGVEVRCPGPGHGPTDRSLCVKIGKDGEPIVHSFAGDDWKICLDYVRQRLGMEPFKPNGSRKTVATYEFRDPTSGAVRYRKERLEAADGTKSFFFKPAGRNGSEPLLYGGEWLADVTSEQPVFIVEGEKKVDRLHDLGAAAVSGDSGYSSKWLPAHADLLRGLHVVLWPDSDEPGEKYISRAADCLKNSAASIKVVRPFGPPNGAKGRDVCDWQGNAEDLAALAAGAEFYVAIAPNGEPPPNGQAKDERQGPAPSVTVMQDADTLEMEIIEWLWLHWLALGKLHLIAGAPEAGKTTIALALAATVSSGDRWPDETRAPAGNVLIWTSEDSLADTIKPRLVRMGADLTRIKFIVAQRTADGKTRPFCPATDMPSLIEAAKTINGGVQLLIIDPIVAAIGTKTNSHNNAETRNSLQPVVDFAETANCAVIGISHFTKGTGGKDPIERVTGSLAFGALPRIVFAAAKTDETAEGDMPRIFVRAKSNIGPSGGGFGYDIDAAPLMERPDIVATRVAWIEPIEGTARELLDAAGPQPENTKKENAEVLLMAILPKGEKRLQTDVEKEAAANGISKATLRRAKTATKVKSTQAQGAWWWCRE